jgi:hypothetical protein
MYDLASKDNKALTKRRSAYRTCCQGRCSKPQYKGPNALFISASRPSEQALLLSVLQ